MTSPTVNPTDNFTQYDNAKPFFGKTLPSWVGKDVASAYRVMTYNFYERLYDNVPNTLAVQIRGDNSAPIYLPSGKKIVEACNRFYAVGWDYNVDGTAGTPEDRAALDTLLKNLFARENIKAKHARQKRYGLIRGDAVWHITADSSKPAGQRVSLHETEPSMAFPILQDNNPDRVIGWHLVDVVVDPRDETKTVCRRQTYRKQNIQADGSATITSELGLYELGAWDDRVTPDNPTPTVTVVVYANDYGTHPPVTLPATITALPVYLVPNGKMSGSTFGKSELLGIETVIRGMNQAASDQDLTLAIQGLGVYWSTAGPPKNADGTDGVFNIGPGEVVEVPVGSDFGRVTGVTAGLPGIEHMNFLMQEAQQSIGIPDTAVGVVDVTVAQSGIALALQMNPLLAHTKEKETESLGIENQMLHDLVNMWLNQFEGFANDSSAVATFTVENPLPKDTATTFTQIIDMVTAVPPVLSVRTAIVMLKAIGFDIPADELTQLQKEAQDRASVASAADPFSQRVNNELGGNQGGNQPPAGPGGTGTATGQAAGTGPSAPAAPVNAHAARNGVTGTPSGPIRATT